MENRHGGMKKRAPVYVVLELLLLEVALELLVRRGIVTVIKEAKSFS